METSGPNRTAARGSIAILTTDEGWNELTSLLGEGWSKDRLTADVIARAIAESWCLLLVDCSIGFDVAVETCQRVRDAGFTRSILCLGRESGACRPDEVVTLDAGADAFIARPLSSDQLRAHAHALVRRESGAYLAPLHLGSIVLDPSTEASYVDGARVHLTPTEFRILTVLIRHAGTCVTATELATLCTGSVDRAKIRVHVAHLAVKLQGAGRVIHNVRGVGYVIRANP